MSAAHVNNVYRHEMQRVAGIIKNILTVLLASRTSRGAT